MNAIHEMLASPKARLAGVGAAVAIAVGLATYATRAAQPAAARDNAAPATTRAAEPKARAARLEFRIVVGNDDEKEGPRLAPERWERYRAELADKGPAAARQRGDEFQWFETGEPIPPGFTAEHGGRRYILLAGRPPHVLLAGGAGDAAWRIERAYPQATQDGSPAIGFELDENGGRLFQRLTASHVGQPLAILLDDRVVSAPVIRSALGRQGMVTGQFTQAQADAFIAALRGDAPAPGPATAPAAIDLGAERLRLELANQDTQRPALFALAEERPPAAVAFARAMDGQAARGHIWLVGRLPLDVYGNDVPDGGRVSVISWTRAGTDLVGRVLLVRPPAGMKVRAHSVYLHAHVPEGLPPGRYTATIRLRDTLRLGDGSIVPTSGAEDAAPPITCTFDVPGPVAGGAAPPPASRPAAP